MTRNAVLFRLRQALWQAVLLFAGACAIALGSNALRKDAIPLAADWSVEARFADAAGQDSMIDLEEARVLFERGAAVFVDARPGSQYAEGHIRGALSLPFHEVDDHFMDVADRLEVPKTIVTYCDGEGCELSHELALFLKQIGFENVRVLVNGWTVWQQAGLPTEAGA